MQENLAFRASSSKIKVAFVYMPCDGLTENYFFTTSYHFFMNSLRKNPDIDVSYFKSGETFDAMKLEKKFDVILLYENSLTPCNPNELKNIKKIGIPVVARVGDLHNSKKFDIEESHEKYGITAYFGYQHEDYFYQYYPRKFDYQTIVFGLEPSLYENLLPFSKRIKNKILNSGAVGNLKLFSKIFNQFRNPDNALNHYKLRTLCNKLSFVDYTNTLQHEYIGDKYPLLLQKYQSSIAATTANFTTKYLEIPAAGCLSFMEVTNQNHASFLNFIDGKNAIFINERNYEEKFKEFLESTDNPEWEQIANSGREHVLKNFGNDTAVKSLVELFKKIL